MVIDRGVLIKVSRLWGFKGHEAMDTDTLLDYLINEIGLGEFRIMVKQLTNEVNNG